MKRSNLPWPTENPRAREEWDFRKGFLPEDEVSWCHDYEIGRICETEGWRKDIAEFRCKFGGGGYDSLWAAAQKCRRTLTPIEWPSVFYTLWPEWPTKPYLTVSLPERKRRIGHWSRAAQAEVLGMVSFQKLFLKDRYILSLLRIQAFSEGRCNLPPEQLRIETLEDTIPDQGPEIVAFHIPSYGTTDEVVAMFREWLVRWRKDHRYKEPELRGAGSPVKRMRADLCSIGFWRLVRSGFTRHQAVLHTQRISGRKLISDHPSRWAGALKRAAGLLRYRIGKDFES